jgi:hypothetical protein
VSTVVDSSRRRHLSVPLPRRVWPFALAALLLAAGAAVLVLGVFSSDDSKGSSPTLHGSAAAPYRLNYPRSWKPLDAAHRAQLPGQPLAVLRREDGRGTVVLALRPPVRDPLETLPKGLKAQLSTRFTDFREIGAKLLSLHGTRALIYTFARTKTGTVQSIVVIPSGTHSFTLNAVVPPRSPDVAREEGAMIASFDPTGDR